MTGQRALAILMLGIVLVWALFAATHARASILFPSTYDDQIESAVSKWWPDYPDWLDWRGQLFQESRLDPNARSSVGAEGLAQFMPGTFQDVMRAMGQVPVSRTLAGPAIEGGAYYMAGLRRSWASPRPMDDRQRLAQASYNAGTGSLLKAQRLCDGAILYAAIAACLPQVTGSANAKQTTDYVTRIAYWRELMN